MAVPSHNPFDGLPIETNQHIATYLTTDSDLCTFRLVSQSTHDAVDADNNSFWRRRFLSVFETPTWGVTRSASQNVKFKFEYQRRRKCLMFGAKYEAALVRRDAVQIRKGTQALEVVREMLVDAFSDRPTNNTKIYESSNLKAVLNFISNHDLLNFVLLPDRNPPPPQQHFRTRSSPRSTNNSASASASTMDIVCLPKDLLQTIQILLAPAMFDIDRHFNHFSFPFSQEVVYGTGSQHQIFTGANGLDISPPWLLHHINFWKFHMMRHAECTLAAPFADLPPASRPRFWDTQLTQSNGTLGKNWKGSYAYLDRDHMSAIRAGKGHTDPIPDEFNGEADGARSFQDLRLELVDDKDSFWPATFESHLRALTLPPSRAKTRAQKRSTDASTISNLRPQSFHFHGDGSDSSESFLSAGWLNALPPQNGVPGWQRMTMMKYFESDEGFVDEEGLWAYEGVVLPGGQIMVGRWWSPGNGVGEDMYSGPYMLWCVDGVEREDGDGEGREGSVDVDQLP
ncbi:hypothetical protein LTS10_012202 [Elasticomyces elasticus]|nr:hypothetical protein LTS10_012202 [Elasticomyces elasticus]